jgi:hypothetical protein
MTLRNAMTTLSAIGSLLVAAGSCAAAPLPGWRGGLRDRAAGYELTVLVDGVPAPTYVHDGETYVLGQLGARYTLRVSNHSGRRIEAVVSVDGRDAIDGRPADFRGKRGYLVPAWGSIDIDGWRISHQEAAAFRFSSVPDSYAARTGGGREVGVVGVAIFPERVLPPPYAYRRLPYPHRPYPYPYEDNYGAPSGSSGGRAEADKGSNAPPPATGAAPAPTPTAPDAQPAPRAQGEAGRAYGDGAEESRARPGLGTEYGEAVSSPIYEVEFVRANAYRPSTMLGLRYDDREGLLAMGIDVDGYPPSCASESDLRRTAEPFPAGDRRFAAPPAGWRAACEWR